MPTDLTVIFGNEICVAPQPHLIDRQYSGFPGGEGLTAMHLGSRGYQLTIQGTLRANSRPLLETAIAAIANYLWYGAADYVFYSCNYYYVVFERFEIIKDNNGKAFHLVAGGQVTCKFIMHARALV